MQLVYSTNELALARQLAELLEQAGIAVHVANEQTAQMPGLLFNRTPGFVGVWLLSPSQSEQALALMAANGFAPVRSGKREATGARVAPWKIIGLTALFVAVLGALAAIAP